jgi:hypothetical protein
VCFHLGRKVVSELVLPSSISALAINSQGGLKVLYRALKAVCLIGSTGSFGYHADDGGGFENGNVIGGFGPAWAAEDTVVGCGIDFAKSKFNNSLLMC